MNVMKPIQIIKTFMLTLVLKSRLFINISGIFVTSPNYCFTCQDFIYNKELLVMWSVQTLNAKRLGGYGGWNSVQFCKLHCIQFMKAVLYISQ